MTHDTSDSVPPAVARRTRRIARAEREEAGLAIGSIGGFDVAYRLDSADEDVIGHSFEKDIFLAALPDYVLPTNGVVLDVGAHIGTFSLLTARMASQGRVLAIEACRETCDLLRINAALNGLANIAVHHAALGATDGMAHLYHDAGGNWGHTIMQSLSPHSEAVRSISLDTLIKDAGVDRIDLAKFNCEGAEFPILLNASDDALRVFRTMIVLYHCDLSSGQSHELLLARLASVGFATEVRDVWGERGWILATRA
ncbi:MAG: FkbM family methyltransferase [Hyphomicrobiaceae bacterium]